ncbi:actin-related protein 5-like isoform X1 [Haliotis rufescens]|uniref:actin-related protein 5-like isoform X1 n=1 Tax=Haliotis rufescens TaxID=6454 RepID=UPI001EB09C04|nr:actin-related protein 5-like isoform X1 [Haliotis rufescens]XP_048245170.1 actin-related protein 5-like isoform X1 [Haliotis rufescens]
MSVPNLFSFKDEKPVPDPVHEYSDSLRDGKVPLVIDNGTYQCRAGWASKEKPLLTFKNITAKQRGKKESDLQIGNDISNIEVVRWILRTQFDRNVVTLYDVQEQIFDYIFTHLGINTEGKVDHPIVLTEPVCNPNYCRQQMSELMFECYHVPQVAYGIDSLFSLYKNKPHTGSANWMNSLIVDCGYQATHILPVLNGRLDSVNGRRMNLGGVHVDSFLMRLLQLKYPGHLAAVTLSRAEELVRDHAYLATDYADNLHQWLDGDYFENNAHKIQLPYTNVSGGSQLTPDQQRERREQQIQRLKEVNSKRRLEKLEVEEERLRQLMSVQELLVDGDEDTFTKALYNVGFKSAEELQDTVNKLTVSIQRAKAKILGVELPPEEPQEVKEPVFDLLDIPDEMLGPEQQAAKKRQRILKSAREGRLKAQALQRAKRQKELEEERRLEVKRQADFHGWLSEVRKKRQKILEARTSRRQRKTDMAKRGTYASQQRMKIISQLAQNVKSSKKEDTFGQNDADWDVYKSINTEMNTSDSEAEEEKLEELETMLREHDPDFQRELDFGGLPGGEFDIADYYRLYLAVERVRAPEVLFQPSMIGVEQAGIAETADFVLKKYDAASQNSLVQNVFITGGNAWLPGFRERLVRDLRQIRPFQSTFNVSVAGNPSLDSWLGARKWALSPHLSSCSITRGEYEEMGEGYLREHFASNKFIPTPVLVQKT